MADIGYPELAEGIGVQTGDTLVDLANTAADFLCDAYATAADAIIGGPLDNPGARFADGLARRICAPRNKLPPNPPAPPFTGGQCPVDYLVTSAAQVNGSLVSQTTFTVRGPVGPIYTLSQSGSPDFKVTGFYSRDSNGGLVRNDKRSQEAQSFAEQGVTTVILNVVRSDSQPDNCGNPGPTYTGKIPTIPSLRDTRPWPIPGVNIPVDIEITPVKFEPGINIKPEFNINVGGVQVKFDITGAKINIGPQFNFPPQLPPGQDPRVPAPTPEPIKDVQTGVDEANEKLDEILDELVDVKECACSEEKPLLTQLLGSGTGDAYVLPDNCKFVKVQLDNISPNAKVEFGNNTSPDVYYAGWCCFSTQAGNDERKPLSWQTSSVEAPSKATGFSFTVRKGYTATCVAYYEQPDE